MYKSTFLLSFQILLITVKVSAVYGMCVKMRIYINIRNIIIIIILITIQTKLFVFFFFLSRLFQVGFVFHNPSCSAFVYLYNTTLITDLLLALLSMQVPFVPKKKNKHQTCFTVCVRAPYRIHENKIRLPTHGNGIFFTVTSRYSTAITQ